MARVCSFSGPLSGVGDNNECTFEPQPPNQPCQNHHFSNHEGATRVIRGPPNLTTVRAGRLHRLPMRLLLSVPSQNKYFCKGQADQTEHNVQPTHTNSFSLSLALLFPKKNCSGQEPAQGHQPRCPQPASTQTIQHLHTPAPSRPLARAPSFAEVRGCDPQPLRLPLLPPSLVHSILFTSRG